MFSNTFNTYRIKKKTANATRLQCNILNDVLSYLSYCTHIPDKLHVWFILQNKSTIYALHTNYSTRPTYTIRIPYVSTLLQYVQNISPLYTVLFRPVGQQNNGDRMAPLCPVPTSSIDQLNYSEGVIYVHHSG